MSKNAAVTNTFPSTVLVILILRLYFLCLVIILIGCFLNIRFTWTANAEAFVSFANFIELSDLKVLIIKITTKKKVN